VASEESRALLAAYIAEVWDGADPEAVRRFASPGYRRHVNATSDPLDVDAQITRLEGMRMAFPDIAITVESVLAEGDWVAFRGVITGTHDGPFLGIPATGRAIRVGIVDMVRIEDGRFTDQWGGPDMLDLLRQIGAEISPPSG
jgi:steroid delta-isomerase-like uncharacterized protein